MMNWEIGIDMYTLICIKWTTNKNLLYKKKKTHEMVSINEARIPVEKPNYLHIIKCFYSII